MTMHREIELKLELSPEDAHCLAHIPPLALATSARQHQESIYFDTRGRDLQKAGFSLRVRRSGDTVTQTVKARNGGAGLFDREEWEVPIGAMKPDLEAARETPLGALLMPKSRARLQSVARIEIDRTSWKIGDEDDLIEVTLDGGLVSAGKASQEINELELELKHGSEKALFALCDRLGEQVPMRLGVISKADRAFAIATGKLDRASKATRADIHGDMSVAEGFAAIVLSCLQHFRLNEPVFIDHRHVEALHQLRVATRRLRSAFDLFRPILRRSRRYRRLRREWRRLSRRLGDARNVDVALTLVDCHCVDLQRVKQAREDSYDRVMAILNSRRFRTVTLELVRWLFIGKWRACTSASLPLKSFAAWRVDKAWARLCANDDTLAAMGDQQRHRFRVRIKQFRYVLDFLRSLHHGAKKERKAFRASIGALQDNLGLLNDIRMADHMAALNGCSIGPAVGSHSRADLLGQAENHRSQLAAVGPYWRK